jgi:hypothetical protein
MVVLNLSRALVRAALAAMIVSVALVPVGCGPRLSLHERTAADALGRAKDHLAAASTPAEERQIVVELLRIAGRYPTTSQGRQAYTLAETTFLGMIDPGSGLTYFTDEVPDPPLGYNRIHVDPLREYVGFRGMVPEPFQGSALVTASREALLDYAEGVARNLSGIGTDRVIWASLMRRNGAAENFSSLPADQAEELAYVGRLLSCLGQSKDMKAAWARLVAVASSANSGIISSGTDINGNTISTQWSPVQISEVEKSGTALKLKAVQVQAVFARLRT